MVVINMMDVWLLLMLGM